MLIRCIFGMVLMARMVEMTTIGVNVVTQSRPKKWNRVKSLRIIPSPMAQIVALRLGGMVKKQAYMMVDTSYLAQGPWKPWTKIHLWPMLTIV